jgi:ribosomal protein L29
MADKTPKTAKKVVKKEAPVVKSAEELKKDLVAKQEDMLQARKGHRSGELVNPRVITLTRKEIARIKTAIRALELKGEK